MIKNIEKTGLNVFFETKILHKNPITSFLTYIRNVFASKKDIGQNPQNRKDFRFYLKTLSLVNNCSLNNRGQQEAPTIKCNKTLKRFFDCFILVTDEVLICSGSNRLFFPKKLIFVLDQLGSTVPDNLVEIVYKPFSCVVFVSLFWKLIKGHVLNSTFLKLVTFSALQLVWKQKVLLAQCFKKMAICP